MDGPSVTAPRILALDLSLTATGICFDGDTRLLKFPKLRGWARIEAITDAIDDLASVSDLVVLEGYSFGSRGATLFQIAELGGIVRCDLVRRRVVYVDVPPSTLKRFATGRGNATKIDMVVAARERFGLCGTTDDNEADAYLLWCMARHAYGDPVADVPKVQAEAIKAVAWPARLATV